MRLRARWVWLPEGPKENVVVSIEHHRIVEIEEHSGSSVDVDLGDVCLLPKFVNAHTHLEFSDLADPIDPSIGFAQWIGKVVQHRREQYASCECGDPQQTAFAWQSLRRDAIVQGLAESGASGVGCLVDMVTEPWNPTWILEQPPKKLLYPIEVWALGEMLGVNDERTAESLARAGSFRAYHDATPAWLTQRDTISQSENETGDGDLSSSTRSMKGLQNDLRYGLSPHAPYTTPIYLVRESVQRSEAMGGLVSMHLAESLEELEWVRDRKGPLLDMLERFAPSFVVAKNEPRSFVEYIRVLRQARKSFVVHGNYLDAESIQEIASARDRMAVVYCPRTHAAFGHGPHPWRRLQASGVSVFLGTDSRASNPDLHVLQEARFLYQSIEGLDPDGLIDMITKWPAEFLGCTSYAGKIAVGAYSPKLAVPCDVTRADQVSDAILQAVRVPSNNKSA